jgi:nucleotide-binding universal stress UspA family protein
MFRELLVPVDLSDHNRIAFDALREVAAPGASVELLHVVEQVTREADPEFEAFHRAFERKAREKLERWCEALRKDGFAARTRVCVGRRGAEILRRAGESRCDLILMASHAITGPEGPLGTLSHQVAMLAPCSVLLVRTATP